MSEYDSEPDHESIRSPPARPPQRVFRVTTLKGGDDYESIPLQRLQKTMGSKGFGRGLVWFFSLIVMFSVGAFVVYMDAMEKLHVAQKGKRLVLCVN